LSSNFTSTSQSILPQETGERIDSSGILFQDNNFQRTKQTDLRTPRPAGNEFRQNATGRLAWTIFSKPALNPSQPPRPRDPEMPQRKRSGVGIRLHSHGKRFRWFAPSGMHLKASRAGTGGRKFHPQWLSTGGDEFIE
jgi:hypothetical protein